MGLRAMTVASGGRTVHVRPYPISVDPSSVTQLARSRPVERQQVALSSSYQTEDRQLVLRVDRTDPPKNIVRGFRAFDVLLTDHPELAV